MPIFATVANNPNFQAMLALVAVDILYQLTGKLPINDEKSVINPHTFKISYYSRQ
jgi:hypothetical protein